VWCAKLEQSHRTIGVVCKTGTIAPHIHVLYCDIPFILNIIATGFADPSYIDTL
jgi:hypothetical protein